MKNSQEIWTTMIISAYSKKMGITITEAARNLLSSGCIDYLDEYYQTLHLLSNDDVVNDLMDMAGVKKSN